MEKINVSSLSRSPAKKIISSNSMNNNTTNQLLHKLLDGISLDDLQLLVDLKEKIHSNQLRPTPIPAIRTKKLLPKPIPAHRKSVKDMVQDYEDNIILPPLEFRDDYKPVPLPRTKKPIVQPKPIPAIRTKKPIVQPKPIPAIRTKKPIVQPKPIPALRTKIEETDRAMKGYTSSYKINIKHSTDPLSQLQNTRIALGHHISKALSAMKGLKFVETLKVTFSKPQDDGLIYKSAFFNSKPQTVINNLNISESLELTKQQILNFVAQWISEGSGWTIESVDDHYINIVQYKPMEGNSHIILPQELRNSAKGLINMKNKDNECFRWCHIRYLNPQDKYPQRIKKSDRKYVDKLNYNDIEFPVAVKHYNKIEKQNEINISVFGYENKQPYPIYVSKEKYKDHMELLLITKDENKHYVLIKDFNKFMFNQTKNKNKKHFCMQCMQCFSSERVLNNHKDICIQVNGAQAVKMPDKNNNILKYNNYHKQQAVPFVIYADFEAITEKISGCQPNNNKSYTEAYQKHTDCGYGYKVVCCYDDKYTKPTQIYRGEKAVYKFMEAMLEEVKYCKTTMKQCFNKPLKMTSDDVNAFEKAKECHICNKQYTEKDIRVRDHCHITGKYRGSAHQ